MSPLDAVVFLPFTLAIGIWVAWNDMKFMKIPNKAVMALLGVFVVLGLIVLPLPVYGWGLVLGAGVLTVGFLGATVGLFGAGDAKFAAAMAPFFVQGALGSILLLCSACMLGAFVAHRAAKHLPAMRRNSPDWASWAHADFPMGLALAGILNIYLILRATALIAA
jgi:prepilin peptidase CpaA